MALKDVEMVTPEGRFASIRIPTVIDAFAARFYDSEMNKVESLMILCTLCVTLDGERVTKEILGNLPMYEMDAIIAKLVELMRQPPRKPQ